MRFMRALGGFPAIAALAVLVTLAAAVLASSAGAGRTTATARVAQSSTVKPYTAAQWNALVAKAKAEGEVVLYSGQTSLGLQRVADAFKKKYGINVTTIRLIDNASRAAVNAEITTGKAIADVWELSSRAITLGALKNGWAVDARGPALFTKQFDRKKYTVGKAVIVGVGLLGMAWNTNAVSNVRDVPDFLTPQFANGKLGVPDPAVSPSIIDYYLWLEKNYGANILQRLAAQHPKIYVGVQPLQQAIESGEIVGAPYSTPAVLADRENGAPINFKIPLKGAWNVPFQTMILKQAPHPAAAQLLMNFEISREGQKAANYRAGAIYPGIPDTFYVAPRKQRLSDFTQDKIAAFQARFNSLFR